MKQSTPRCSKRGRLHFIVSTTSGQAPWTSLRRRVRIGRANGAAAAMYASTRGSFFGIMASR
jgi:hypothetical protein